MRKFYDWCDIVTAQVRFQPDRAAIERELEAHYEDHVKDLERIGYDHDLAESRALQAMGDAEEVGRALDRVHKPWLGWLWLASKVLAIFCVAATILYLGSSDDWYEIKRDLFRSGDPRDYEAEGFFRESGTPYFTRVATTSCGSKTVGDYELTIPYAALWKREFPDDGPPVYYMTVVLTASDDRFWDDDPWPAMDFVYMTDDQGHEMANYKEYRQYTAKERRERWDGFVGFYSSDKNPFYEEYWLSACYFEEPPQWTDLICTSGEGFRFRLEWEVTE